MVANLLSRGIMRPLSLREIEHVDAPWLLWLLEAQDIIAETNAAKRQLQLSEPEPEGWGDG